MLNFISKLKHPRRILFWIIVAFSTTILSHGGNAGQGDEPHYMMIAHSLWFDHDLDLRNNYADQSNIIYNGNLGKEPHTRIGVDGGWYSTHSFGLPLVALPIFGPAYKASELISESFLRMIHLTKWTFLRDMLAVSMILLAATLAILLYDSLALTIPTPFAFLTVLASFLACPLLPLGFLFFTEMPAAFLAFVGFRQDDSLTFRSLALRSAAISYLPYLHVKYMVLSGALLLLLCVECWKRENRIQKIGLAIGMFLVAQAILAAVNYRCWGSIAPYASWGGIALSQEMYGKGLLGLLVDQQFGLIFVAPLYWLSMAGAFIYWKRGKKKDLLRLLFALASVLIVFANFPMWWAGWSPYARFLTPAVIFVIPLVATAVEFYWNNRFEGFVVKALMSYQVLLGLYFWQRQKLMWNLPDGTGKLFRSITNYLPSIVVSTPRDFLLAAIWILAGLLLAIPFLRTAQKSISVGS